MNSLTPVYFPGTDIYSIRQYPVFLLFQNLHLIKPVEDDPAEAGRKSSDTFINSGFCQVHTPCPLGENRSRFLHLVEDIRIRKDDYAAQLSALTLAGTGASYEDEASEASIISSLLDPGGLEAKAEQLKREEELWQARLVLAIGEILDIEDEEIAKNLAVLEDEQTGLFKKLHGDIYSDEEESPFEELSQLESHLITSHSGNLKTRFNSWKTLFFESDLDKGVIFLTQSKDGGEIMLELYEKMTGNPAPLLQGLELPGLVGWNGEEAHAKVTQFTINNSALLELLHGQFTQITTEENYQAKAAELSAAFTETANQWNRHLENAFPAKQYGRIPVSLYIFPRISCKAIAEETMPTPDSSENGLLLIVD